MSSEKLAGALREIRDIMKIDGGFPNTVPAINEVLAAHESKGMIEVDRKRLMRHLKSFQQWQELHRCHYPEGYDFREIPINDRVEKHLAYLRREDEENETS